MAADVVSSQASVGVPHSPVGLKGILSDKLNVLRQTGVVNVCYIADLVRAGTQELACLDVGSMYVGVRGRC